MIIVLQAILVIAILAMGINFMRSRQSSKTKAYKKLLLLLSLPCAVIFIVYPESANSIASFFGVGRGADLLLYGLTTVVLFQLFNNYLKDKEEEKRFVQLARKIAIIEAELNNLNDKKSK